MSMLSEDRADTGVNSTPAEGHAAQAAAPIPVQTQAAAPAQRPIPMLKVLVVLAGGLAVIWYFGSQGGFVSGGLIIGVVMLAVILLAGLFGGKRP